jgi:hypothetical protein
MFGSHKLQNCCDGFRDLHVARVEHDARVEHGRRELIPVVHPD